MAVATVPDLKGPLWAYNLRKSCGKLDSHLDLFDDWARAILATMKVGSLATSGPSNAILTDVHTHLTVTRSGVGLVRTVVTWLEVIGGSLGETLRLKKFMTLMIKTLLVAGRTLSTLMWAHRKSPFLGEHAKGIGISVSCIFTAVNALSFVKAVKDYFAPHLQQDKYREAMHRELDVANRDDLATAYAVRRRAQAKVNCLSTFLELACSPWECGLFHSNSYAASVVGSVLNFISAGVKLFTHSHYFDLADGPEPEEPTGGGPSAATLSYPS